MKRAGFVVLTSLILGLACQSPGKADTVSAAQEQKQTLKGITSISYGVIDYSKSSSIDDVTASLSGLKIKSKAIQNFKEDSNSPLASTEAKLKVVAKYRENNQYWVGLYVEQRCQLKRAPSIDLNSETYAIGRLCPRTGVKAAVTDLCAEFVKDFSSAK